MHRGYRPRLRRQEDTETCPACHTRRVLAPPPINTMYCPNTDCAYEREALMRGVREVTQQLRAQQTRKPIDTAPTKPIKGTRGPRVVGVDVTGRIGHTFYSTGHPKGDGWLLVPHPEPDDCVMDGPGLMEWHPVWWAPHPLGDFMWRGD